ncbi:UDP-N-acetylglucosamine 2-epimerase (non-hydrolysing) [Nitrosospira briensis]|uniref:UDP-N-acetylglucosamine 2-epimerase (non-hydrolyzing) n=1 Tax=Nitrosospira briensis TaxID=35799 RepID=A0A1I5C6K7_9PROT|nr:UDP-N-acetylglucosamine 2-epimerase (non-hydrolyzing) [Nitrosospira briensis]SFN82464.1 UDP-N-acetylglucosamine 2-epimerase (non-hydrolysing) [Nitrosospira briensis]
MNHKILCVVGTRPEAIKMAPVILALKKNPDIECRILATAQHRDLLDQVLRIFEIEPDIDLDIMRPDQALTALTARLLLSLDDVLQVEKPDAVLAQGDTTTVMSVALACFYREIPFGHVEAGLRTGDMSNPFPEEMNRVVTARLTKWHFAPTESARQNLLKEGIADSDIFVTGNTVIDALLSVAEREIPLPFPLALDKRLILVTAHRRENFGEPFKQICRAILALVERNQDVHVVYPVHPNPNVYDLASQLLGNRPRITLCEPLDYLPFVQIMKRAYLILSDSGGVQEEAPALGKPVLVLRRKTERPEAVQEGVVRLVGADFDEITSTTQRLLDDEAAYKEMARGVSPYGDGKASSRIAAVLRTYFAACV